MSKIIRGSPEHRLNGIMATLFHVFIICAVFNPAWGQTNYEKCENAFKEKDYTSAYSVCKESAQEGNMFAEGYLATMYNTGLGVDQDYSAAAFWFRKSAEHGVIAAMVKLGKMYFKGDGIKQDYAESAFWYRKAAEQGIDEAQILIADMYYRGQGVDRDYAEAAKWCRKAADQGNETAKEYLRQLSCELPEKYIHGDGVDINRHLAEKWLYHCIFNNPKDNKSMELLEREFGWHCLLTDDGRCTERINKDSILHSKSLSWYWSETDMRIPKLEINGIVRTYNVMNCSSRTTGLKTFQSLNYDDLHIINTVNVRDENIEFRPLEPNRYNDRLFNYVCGMTGVDKKTEGVQEVSLGTGWPIQPGYIVTNQHVIAGKKKIAVIFTSGVKVSATVLIEDQINDLALLQVEHPDKLPQALPIAKAPAKTGSKVFTIGYPHPDVMGAKPKLTDGIVNALSGYKDDPRILQISVPVQSGNSGGPLLNMNGEVIGIVTAKLSAIKMFNWTGDLPQNVNYAVKASYINALLNSVEERSTTIKVLPAKRAELESLSSRIQNSVFLVIAE